MAYLVPKPIFVVKSSLINFKTTGNTILYTTKANESLMFVSTGILIASATAANGDAQYNLGWTAATYLDWGSAYTSTPTIANEFSVLPYGSDGASSAPYAILPPSTSLRINITAAESGTALTGYVYLHLFIA